MKKENIYKFLLIGLFALMKHCARTILTICGWRVNCTDYIGRKVNYGHHQSKRFGT